MLAKTIAAGNGRAGLTTVASEKLSATMNGMRNIALTDAEGGVAPITTYDVIQSNKVIQVIDKVLLPG